jgi:hypothetical protein
MDTSAKTSRDNRNKEEKVAHRANLSMGTFSFNKKLLKLESFYSKTDAVSRPKQENNYIIGKLK